MGEANMQTEEYVVKFWVKNNLGFDEQQNKSFYYDSKNKHKQAEIDCVMFMEKEGKKISIISVTYQ